MLKELYQRLFSDFNSCINEVRKFEKRYDLRLSYYDEGDADFWAWRATYYTFPSSFWVDVSKDEKIPLEFIRLYKDYLVWDVIYYQKFAENKTFFREFVDYIDWWKFSEFFVANNDESTIREFKDYIDVRKYDRFHWNVGPNFIREFRDKINWVDTDTLQLHATNAFKNVKICDEYANEIISISNSERLTYKFDFYSNLKFGKKMFLRFYQPHTVSSLLYYDILDEEALEDCIIPEHKDNKEIMRLMFEHETLTEQFIEKYIDIINKFNLWSVISSSHQLSEQFIDKYAKKVNWCKIIKFQKVSEKFLEEHLKYIDKNMSLLIQSKNLSEEFIEKHLDKISIPTLVHNQILSEKFINKYLNDNVYLKDIALQKRRGEEYDVAQA